jgi:hypothetical protein
MELWKLLSGGLLDAEVGPTICVPVDEERDLMAGVALALGVTMLLGLTMLIMLLIDALPITSITQRRFWGVHSGAVFLRQRREDRSEFRAARRYLC